MTTTPESNLDSAKSHLIEAKDDIKAATHSKVEETTISVGEKLKDGIDHVVDKVTNKSAE
jgi:imidazoleglycerol phosphate dehydratase HisB